MNIQETIRFSLLAQLYNNDVDKAHSVLEIVNATPNPDLAILILIGQEPKYEFAEHSRAQEYRKDDPVCTFINYNKWEDEVHYSYEYKEYKTLYFSEEDHAKLADTDREDPVNYVAAAEIAIDYSSKAKSLSFYTGKTNVSKGTCSAEKWSKNRIYQPE